jgi:hypothetical protein
MDRENDLPTKGASVAMNITVGANGLANLDGAAQRDYLIAQNSQDKDWLWERWNAFTLWQKTAERLPAEAAPPLIVHELDGFLDLKVAQREPLLVTTEHATTILSQRSINQLFAWRGAGKSMLAFGISGALATGGKFLAWAATGRAKVLFVEGETPDAQLQERARLLVGEAGGFFRIVTLDQQPSGIPNLGSASGQAALEAVRGDSEVLILDSISTLTRFGTNDEEEWLDFLGWFRHLRSRGLCVLFLHHAGKSGMQRGHSRSEDMLDVSIKLERASDEEEQAGLNVNLIFDKFRGDRSGVRNLVVEFSLGKWKWQTRADEKRQVLEAYLKDHPGAANRTIARDNPELGSHMAVSRLRRKFGLTVIDGGKKEKQ